jgi:hypothetical protein
MLGATLGRAGLNKTWKEIKKFSDQNSSHLTIIHIKYFKSYHPP